MAFALLNNGIVDTVSFAEVDGEEGWIEVEDDVYAGDVLQRDGSFKRAISGASPSALWDQLRNERNARLNASDWTQVADAPVDKAAWAIYRQALRELPGVTTDPAAPAWPLKPHQLNH